MNESSRGDGLMERPAQVNELTPVQLSEFERHDEDADRIGFQMSAEAYE